VTWQEAYAFCIWDGGFLPSAAEWEYVAAGGSQQREYPWGSGGDSPQYAITGSGDPCDGESGCSNYPGGTCTVADIAPVGYAQLGAGLWGQLDLAGDAWQWTLDRYDAYVTPCLDCALITSGDPAATSRIIHGGSFTDALQFAQPPALFWELPTMRSYCTGDIGFRCARPPE
jgi:formylglycine-generating enzyme required for sulfatase activity